MIKLPDFLSDATLNRVRDEMGAYELGDLSLQRDSKTLTLAELDTLIGDGIDIGSLDEVKVHDDGTLVYKNRRVILYIRDIADYGRGDRNQSLPKFHVANCQTLEEMRSRKRFGRYVVAARTTGLFLINWLTKGIKPRSADERLSVCQNCLKHLAFDGFSFDISRDRRAAIVDSFTLARFYERYPHDVISQDGAEGELTARLNEYTGNFGRYALAAKQRAGCTCENCGIFLGAQSLRRYLHAHHHNALKHDNSPENLKALCIRCHANEPGHGHMKTLPEYAQFIAMDIGSN